ncbi:MAG: 5'-deoxynucleotidase [Clostridia bacterium]|nr:5'-deoxynucleotidase [Clostridia bacterium]
MEHHFFAYVSRMRYIQRWGLMRNTLSENDLEHSMQAAFFAHAIAVIGVKRYHRTYSPERIMAMAAYHDATEVITGDMPTPVKYHHREMKDQYGKMEELAERRLMQMLPNDLRPAFEPLICHDESTDEWRIVKAADKICAYVKCLEEKKAGNTEFDMARKSTKKALDRLDLPEVQDFMTEFVPGFSLTLDEISEMEDR